MDASDGFRTADTATKRKLASANQKEIAMNPILALTTLDETRARENERQAPTAFRQASGSSTSASLIVVMIVYVLFGFAGFYLAA
jgi:hypothetical protein